MVVDSSEFEIENFRIMGFTSRREPNLLKKPLTNLRYPIFLQGVKISVVGIHKSLGILLNQELSEGTHCIAEYLFHGYGLSICI